MTYWKVLFYGKDIEDLQKLFNKALDAINNDFIYISEEEYYNNCDCVPKDVSILPYENAIEDAWDTHTSFKYNLISMTLIQLYSIWEQQIKDYNTICNHDLVDKDVLSKELRLLNNTLKHGYESSYKSSYKKLKKEYPRYFNHCEENRYIPAPKKMQF